MMKHKVAVVVLAITALTGLSAGAFYSRSGEGKPTVLAEAVTRGPIMTNISASGTLEAVTTVEVGTQVSGTVESLHADYNAIVKKGQVVARLEPSLFRSAVEQARANLVRAEADEERQQVAIGDAEAKLQRARELAARKLIPATELDAAVVARDSARAQVKSAQAAVIQARASLRQAQVNLDKTTIASPIDGIVIARNVDVGQTVAASLQAPTLFVIAADLRRMQVNASVDESDVGQILPGQEVTFTVDAYPQKRFSGTVEQVRLNPTVVSNVVTYAAIIDAPNPSLELKPGMTANVTVEVSRRDSVLRVPNAALRFRPSEEVLAALGLKQPAEAPSGRTVVWKQRDDGALEAVAVSAGASDGVATEIEGPLDEGARVVTRVTLPGAATRAATATASPLIPSPPPRR